MNRLNKKNSLFSLAAIGTIVGLTSIFAFKSKQPDKIDNSAVVQMNRAMYIDKIHDMTTSSKTFIYKGARPAVVDFYADWCRPCKRIAPIMEELSEQYKGKVDFYKVNVDNESELAMIHNIQSIPAVFFFNGNKEPKLALGALNKEDYISLIEENLKK